MYVYMNEIEGIEMAEIKFGEISIWPCEECQTDMELLSETDKIFWCPTCGTISKGFPTSVWTTPTRVDDGR